MTVEQWTEQLWWAVAVAGTLIFLEEGFIYILRSVLKKNIPKEFPRMGAGLLLLGYGMFRLFTMTPIN